jgi:hypothetical protein
VRARTRVQTPTVFGGTRRAAMRLVLRENCAARRQSGELLLTGGRVGGLGLDGCAPRRSAARRRTATRLAPREHCAALKQSGELLLT